MGLYVYAVCRTGDDDPPALPELPGVLDQPVYRFDAGSLCAVVSECPLETVRAERRHIAASQRIVTALSDQERDLLPMAFGTVTPSPDALRSFLTEHGERLEAQLRRIAGAVEMSLRLILDVDDPIAFLVGRTPALQAARARTFGGRRPPSHDDRIRLGQMVDAELGRYREACTAQAVAALADACAETLALPARGEKEIANLALLVPRTELARLGTAVDAAAAALDDALTVTIGGPWPPHNFIAAETHVR